MKELKIKNREKREIEGLKIITYCICSSYDFRMPEIWVPVASKEVPVASGRVGVASKGVRVASRGVLIGSKFSRGAVGRYASPEVLVSCLPLIKEKPMPDNLGPILREPPLAHAAHDWDEAARRLRYIYNGRAVVSMVVPGGQEVGFQVFNL